MSGVATDGMHALATAADGAIQLFFGDTWEAKTNVVAHAGVGATCFCVGGNGNVLISGGGDGCVRRWKM